MADNGGREMSEMRCADCHAPHDEDRLRCRSCGGTRVVRTEAPEEPRLPRLEQASEFSLEALS